MSDNKNVKITKDFGIEIKEADDVTKTITAVISKEEVDRDGDIVVLKGINAKHWKENPVIMADHGHTIERLIGKGVGRKYWLDGDKAMLKYQLAIEENPLADMAYRLYKGGYLKTMSISFMPNYDKVEYPEKHPKGARRIFHESEMIEASITPLPSNRSAFMKGLEKAWDEGLLDGEELNEMKDLVPEEKEFETTIVENIKAKDELTTKVKDLAKILQEKIELENKVAELELMLKEQELTEEEEWEQFLAEAFGEEEQSKTEEEWEQFLAEAFGEEEQSDDEDLY